MKKISHIIQFLTCTVFILTLSTCSNVQNSLDVSATSPSTQITIKPKAVEDSYTNWFLFNPSVSGVNPSGQSLQTAASSLTGWQPTIALSTNALYWYSPAISVNYAAGSWQTVLWTSSPASATIVRVEILKVEADGSSQSVISSQDLDVKASGGGNHPTTYTFANIAAQSLSGQRLAVRITVISGSSVTMVYNGNDFPSRLSTAAIILSSSSVASVIGSQSSSSISSSLSSGASSSRVSSANSSSLKSASSLSSSGSSTLLSQGRPVSASTYQPGNLPANGNDGSLTSRWTASDGTFPQWWSVDLQQSDCSLTRVDISWYASATRSYKYKIEVSADGSIYQTVVDKTGNTATGDTSDSFSAAARFVKVTVTGTSAGWASVYEIKVYGSQGTPVSSSSPSTGSTSSSQASSLTTSSSSSSSISSASSTNIYTQSYILDVLDRAANWGLANITVYGHSLYSGNDWSTGTFYTGMMAWYRVTKSASAKSIIMNWGNTNNWQPDMSLPTHPDNMSCMQTYCEMYLQDPVSANAYMYQTAKTVIEQAVSNTNQDFSTWFWWEDGLYMGPPDIALVGKITGETKYYDAVTKVILDCENAYYDKTYHFWYWKKDWVYPLKVTSRLGNPEFWGPGNAWVLGGMIRVMLNMPDTYAKKSEWLRLYRELCEALRTKQLPSGLWSTSLYDVNEFPNPESSSTAFFIYAMVNGVLQGYLDAAVYTPVIKKAWEGLINVCLHPSGQVGYGQPWSNQPGDPGYNNTIPEGQGAFLLACEAMYNFTNYTK